MKDVDCLPKPVNGGDTPILIGGSGEKRTLPLVARYADEWNGVGLALDTYRHKVEVLQAACEVEDRDPATVRRSLMVFGLIAGDERSLDRVTKHHMSMNGATGSPAEYRASKAESNNFFGGLTDEAIDRLGEYAELGLEEVMFEHFNFAYDEVPEYLANEIAPVVSGF